MTRKSKRAQQKRDRENGSAQQDQFSTQVSASTFIKRGRKVTKASSKGGAGSASASDRAQTGGARVDKTFKTQKTSVSYRKMLQDARIAKKWKQKDLAQKMNVALSEVQKWEAGKGSLQRILRRELNRVLG
eukprot:TRINITY_DN2333_c0_g1_i1.p1 TRINITY_DN2333_c0_g1~~TRINITY_DN2333_c0_g1_i1.p1  ORF type:complete len:131 (+),score=15.52 TRINITY_DN2333_c0_g1_i1:165-557(+)